VSRQVRKDMVIGDKEHEQQQQNRIKKLENDLKQQKSRIDTLENRVKGLEKDKSKN
jgi:predicted RNase H-like nuclease (RuvC/YqgF family)